MTSGKGRKTQTSSGWSGHAPSLQLEAANLVSSTASPRCFQAPPRQPPTTEQWGKKRGKINKSIQSERKRNNFVCIWNMLKIPPQTVKSKRQIQKSFRNQSHFYPIIINSWGRKVRRKSSVRILQQDQKQ